MITTVSILALAAGFALCVAEVAFRVFALARRERLNPFSPADAAEVLGGRYADPSAPPYFSTRRGRLALILMGFGLLGLCVALFLWALARP